jgi:hypothetical protein
MNDKSPRQSMTKKSGKSLKEKRADKQNKKSSDLHPAIVPDKKR